MESIHNTIWGSKLMRVIQQYMFEIKIYTFILVMRVIRREIPYKEILFIVSFINLCLIKLNINKMLIFHRICGKHLKYLQG